MLRLTDDVRAWLLERIPDAPLSPKGGRPPLDKARVLAGIFWTLDNGAKWKDLPRGFSSRATVHRWFQRWTREGLSEKAMRAAGRLVEERGAYRVHECFIEAAFSKARGGGDAVVRERGLALVGRFPDVAALRWPLIDPAGRGHSAFPLTVRREQVECPLLVIVPVGVSCYGCAARRP